MTDARLKVALVGLGGHGRTIQHAVATIPEMAVHAVFDVDERLRRAAAERFGCAAVDRFDGVVARDDVEAVILVTPNPLHRRQAEAAFRAGMHVFVEKPIAEGVPDGLAMVAASVRAGKVLMVGHNMRYGQSAREATARIEDGSLGKVVSVDAHFSLDAGLRMPRDSWRRSQPLLPVMQLGIHAIDLVHYLVGNIVSVHARGRSVVVEGAVDSVVATFETDAGVLGTLTSNYCSPPAFTYRLAGTEGTVLATPHELTFRRRADTDGRGMGTARTVEFVSTDVHSYATELREFVRCVHTGTQPEADGIVGVQALAVVEAMQRSVATDAPVAVPMVRNNVGTGGA